MIQQNLVITGGASGIGAMTVEAALAKGWNVAFCDMLQRDEVNPALLRERTSYTQCDVTNSDAMNDFRRQALSFFDVQGAGSLPLAVVANAGISRRGTPEAEQSTRDVNAGGTVNLLSSFRDGLVRTRGTFVGYGSIVAAENIPIKGDHVYQETKVAAWKLAVDIAKIMGIQGFAVFPGAIDTPMTRKEQIFAMLLIGAAQIVGGDTNHPLHQQLLAIAGVEAGASPADILTGAYGPELASSPDFAMCKANFPKHPNLDKPIIAVAYSRFISFLDPQTKVRHARSAVIARAAEVLRQLDVVIGPETVAGRLVDQLASGQIPEQGMLKVYSQSGRDDIKGLLGSFAG